MKKYLLGSVFFCFVFLVSFLSVEFFLRWMTSHSIIYDMEMHKYALQLKRPSQIAGITHEHIPNAKARLMGVEVKINNVGFRGDDFDLEQSKKRGEYRIVVVGNSITLGWGVAQEGVFTEVVQKWIDSNKIAVNGRPIRIINMGIGNFNTQYEAALLKHELARYEPDALVLHFFLRDAEVFSRANQPWVIKNSYLAALAYVRTKQMLSLNSGSYKTLGEYYGNLFEDHSEGWLACQQSVKEIRQLCAENKTRMFVMIQPELNDFRPESIQEKTYDKVRGFLKAEQIVFFDLVPYMRVENDPHVLWNQADDSHPNAQGHALMAAGFYDQLITRQLLWNADSR